MDSKDLITLTGKLVISVNGNVEREIDNLVVTAGKEWVASRMQGVVDDAMSHMAIGTGTTAAAIGDTTLGTESARVALNTAGGTVSANTITYEATFGADVPPLTAPATVAITEAGIFNDASAGTMVARTVFAAINKGETDSITVSWTITIS